MRILISCTQEQIFAPENMDDYICITSTLLPEHIVFSPGTRYRFLDDYPLLASHLLLLAKQGRPLLSVDRGEHCECPYLQPLNNHDAEHLSLFATNLPTTATLQFPMIVNAMVRHDLVRKPIESNIESALSNMQTGENIEAWIVSQFDFDGIHRFVGALLSEIVSRHPSVTLSINFVRVDSPDSSMPDVLRFSPEQEAKQKSLNRFVNLLADWAFMSTIHRFFPRTTVRFFYVGEPIERGGFRESVTRLLKVLMSEEIRNDIERSLINNHCPPMVVVKLQHLGTQDKDGIIRESLCGLLSDIYELTRPSVAISLHPNEEFSEWEASINEKWVAQNIVTCWQEVVAVLNQGNKDTKTWIRGLVEFITSKHPRGTKWSPLTWFFIPEISQEPISCLIAQMEQRSAEELGGEGEIDKIRLVRSCKDALGYRDGEIVGGYLGELRSICNKMCALLDRSRGNKKHINQITAMTRDFVRTLAVVSAILQIEANERLVPTATSILVEDLEKLVGDSRHSCAKEPSYVFAPLMSTVRGVTWLKIALHAHLIGQHALKLIAEERIARMTKSGVSSILAIPDDHNTSGKEILQKAREMTSEQGGANWYGVSLVEENRYLVFPEAEDLRNEIVNQDDLRGYPYAFVRGIPGVYSLSVVTPASEPNLFRLMLSPFAPHARDALQRWDEKNTWEAPSGKAQMAFAGASNEPLHLSAIKTVLAEHEVRIVGEIYHLEDVAVQSR